MEIVYRYDSSEAEYENELPLEGISIQGFYEIGRASCRERV